MQTTTPKISISGTPGTEAKETPSLFRRSGNGSQPAEQAAEYVKPVEQNPFTDEQVKEQWEAFKEARLKKGATDTEKLVLSRRLGKGEEDTVEIALESQLETSILEKFEAELTRFLRKGLSNDLIQLKKVVSEQEEMKNLYTSKEKFEYMSKQNPALRQLKDRLGLDFEY